MAMTSPTDFNLRAQRVVGARKFFELPFGNLLPRHNRASARNMREFLRVMSVGNFVEGIADGEFRGNLRDRKSSRLRRQCRGAARPAVHLDHDHQPVSGFTAELNVRSACFDADFADHGDRGIAHRLVLAIGERLRRSNRNRVAGVHAHGIEFSIEQMMMTVVSGVAHHLEFEFFPTQHWTLQSALRARREIETPAQHFQHFFAVVCDAAARTAQRERGPDNHRETDLARELDAILGVVDQRRLGDVEPRCAAWHL